MSKSFRDALEKDMKKPKKKKPRFGFLGSKSKAYEEAQDVLEDADNQYAQVKEEE